VEVTPVTGALNLTHPNVVTKVGTAGQIVEGGITDQSAANSDRLHIATSGNVGVNTSIPFRPLSVAGASVPYTSANSGSATASIGRGGAQTDETILFGVDDSNSVFSEPYGWIQGIKAGSSARALLLNPNNGPHANVIIGCPEGTFLTPPPNTLTFFLNQATNQLFIRVAYSTGVTHDAILTLP
jgi:hypothetical protein